MQGRWFSKSKLESRLKFAKLNTITHFLNLLKPTVGWKMAVREKPGEYKDLRKNDSSVRADDDGNLLIENIQKNNEGYYLCEAINGIGAG